MENTNWTNKSINNTKQPQTTVIVNNISESNWIWTTWFILALIWLFTWWIPVMWWIMWILWLILSIIWLFKKPRWLAIAWLVISFIGIIIIIFLIWGIATMLHYAN